MTTSRIQQLRLRLAGKALHGAAEVMLPKVQTELSGVLHDVAKRMEDGELDAHERQETLDQFTILRDDLNDVIDILKREE